MHPFHNRVEIRSDAEWVRKNFGPKSRAKRLRNRNENKRRIEKKTAQLKRWLKSPPDAHYSRADKFISSLCKGCAEFRRQYGPLNPKASVMKIKGLSKLNYAMQEDLHEVFTHKWKSAWEKDATRRAILKSYMPALLNVFKG